MRPLNSREKWLLGSCVAVIFLVANGFVARSVLSTLNGGKSKISTLENELADQEMWLEDAPKMEARERWLDGTMPVLGESTLGKLQGDMLQSLQDDVFDRKLKIEKQSLQDIVKEAFYTEVAVRLTIRGAETEIIDWLAELQNPEKFQVIKAMELELDRRAKEDEPQAVCQITIARWFRPDSGQPLTSIKNDVDSEKEDLPSEALAKEG